jgi:DNA sulfur modification protein DndC
MLSLINRDTIQTIKEEYQRSDLPWFVGFSGGKDSSAVVKLLFCALLELRARHRPVTIVYCDTGVEIPLVRRLVSSTLSELREEARVAGVPLRIRLARPHVQDRYFVQVIGKGYPPPTNKFRWCTDRLRIKPVQRILQRVGNAGVVLLGIRRGESAERDRTIASCIRGPYYLRQEGASKTQVFAPIIDYTIDDVWSTLTLLAEPRSIDGRRLALLYKQASGECPIIREPTGSPCSKGRFGCWTCTVVRRDRTVEGLVRDGSGQLEPLLAFRNWLQQIRDSPAWRCKFRRNGTVGPGPFTITARRMILTRLLDTQKRVPWQLISKEELRLIERLWHLDASSEEYRSLEKSSTGS